MFIPTHMTVQFGDLSSAFFQSFKMSGHANLIPITSAFLFWSQLQFSAALLFAVYLFIHSFSTLFQKGYSQGEFT